MNLNAPTQLVFLISLALVILAVISLSVSIPVISANALWVAVIGYVVLVLGNVLKGF